MFEWIVFILLSEQIAIIIFVIVSIHHYKSLPDYDDFHY